MSTSFTSSTPPLFTRVESFSSLSVFTQCKKRYKLHYIDKQPKDENSKESTAAHRGSLIHEEAEAFVKNPTMPITEALIHFELFFRDMQHAFQDKKACVEEAWAFSLNERQVGASSLLTIEAKAWDDPAASFRAKLDLVYFPNNDVANIVDYKTGKRKGNELKHLQQMESYIVFIFSRFTTINLVKASLLYLDHGERQDYYYKRYPEYNMYTQKLLNNIKKVHLEKYWLPTVSYLNCCYCPYRVSCEDSIYNTYNTRKKETPLDFDDLL